MMFDDTHPTQQHNISISGGNKDVKYMVSGAYDYQKGILRMNPDIYRKYNLRSKLDFRINKWATMTNNTSFTAPNILRRETEVWRTLWLTAQIMLLPASL